jgi:hypothetical protein
VNDGYVQLKKHPLERVLQTRGRSTKNTPVKITTNFGIYDYAFNFHSDPELVSQAASFIGEIVEYVDPSLSLGDSGTAIAMMWAGRFSPLRPLGIVLSNKPVKDFQAIHHQAKAVNAWDWRVKDYILCRPDSIFNRRRNKRAIFDHVCIASGIRFAQ